MIQHVVGILYGTPWPYPEDAGVGLHIVSRDLNPALFMEEIMGAGCGQEVAAQLTANLVRDGEIKTTISCNVNLVCAVMGMKKAGASVTVIPPAQKFLDGLT